MYNFKQVFSVVLICFAIAYSLVSIADNKVVVVPFDGNEKCRSPEDPNMFCASGLDEFQIPFNLTVACQPIFQLTEIKYLKIMLDSTGNYQSLKVSQQRPQRDYIEVEMTWRPNVSLAGTGNFRFNVVRRGIAGDALLYQYSNDNYNCGIHFPGDFANIFSQDIDVWHQGPSWRVRPRPSNFGPSGTTVQLNRMEFIKQ